MERHTNITEEGVLYFSRLNWMANLHRNESETLEFKE
jgi:hypothetical protein